MKYLKENYSKMKFEDYLKLEQNDSYSPDQAIKCLFDKVAEMEKLQLEIANYLKKRHQEEMKDLKTEFLRDPEK